MNASLRCLLPAAVLFTSALPLKAVIFEPQDDNAGIGIIQTGGVIYPSVMLLSGISSGETRVVISVDAKGRLIDSLVLGYTDVAFSQAATTALQQWTYEPARVHGSARASRAEVLFTFSNNGGVTVQSLPELGAEKRMITTLQERYSFRTWKLRDLDHIPTPLHVVAPAPVSGSPRHGLKRTVTVEFYIDMEGKVRAAAIDPTEVDDGYAAAAVAAVEQWRFEPPVRKGQAVQVLARQDFTYIPKP